MTSTTDRTPLRMAAWPLLISVLAVPACGILSHAPKDTIVVNGQAIPNPYKNVVLVLHCRLPMFLTKTGNICAERRPLYAGYTRYFGEMIWLTRDECKAGPDEPYRCLSKIMEEKGDRDGLFYMHFDALIRPAQFALTFDKNSMACFGKEDTCPLLPDGLLSNCSWGPWNQVRAEQFRTALSTIQKSGVKELAKFNMDTVHIGMDDLFYIPSRNFELYRTMASAFSKNAVHHEAAGPTMRKILQEVTRIPDTNMSCTGSCCKHLGAELALNEDFRCGHAFELKDKATQRAFRKALAMDRQRLSVKDELSAEDEAELSVDAEAGQVQGTLEDLARIINELTA